MRRVVARLRCGGRASGRPVHQASSEYSLCSCTALGKTYLPATVTSQPAGIRHRLPEWRRTHSTSSSRELTGASFNDKDHADRVAFVPSAAESPWGFGRASQPFGLFVGQPIWRTFLEPRHDAPRERCPIHQPDPTPSPARSDGPRATAGTIIQPPALATMHRQSESTCMTDVGLSLLVRSSHSRNARTSCALTRSRSYCSMSTRRVSVRSSCRSRTR